VPDLQISWRFSKKTRSAERRSEGERGGAEAAMSMPQIRRREPAMIMPRSASHTDSARRTKLFMSRPRGTLTHRRWAWESYMRPCMLGMDGGCTESGSCGRSKEPDRGCRSRSCRRSEDVQVAFAEAIARRRGTQSVLSAKWKLSSGQLPLFVCF